MNDREKFKQMCLVGDLAASKPEHWLPSRICRHCWRAVSEADFAIWHTYWNACWVPSHVGCLLLGQGETVECQTIDADCNDCRHYRREESLSKRSSAGTCLKKNCRTVANVNFATGHSCFEHRRAPQ